MRKGLGIEFAGYTHPERFMILTTTEDLGLIFPGCTRNYVTGSGRLVLGVQGAAATSAARCGACCRRPRSSRPTTS